MQHIRKWRLSHHHDDVKKQLETDQRTYGSINREASPTFGGWKDSPVTDLIAVLSYERGHDAMVDQCQGETRHLQEDAHTLSEQSLATL